MFVLCRSKPFARNLISYSQIDQKEKKQEETIERPANQVEEKIGMEINFVLFSNIRKLRK